MAAQVALLPRRPDDSVVCILRAMVPVAAGEAGADVGAITTWIGACLEGDLAWLRDTPTLRQIVAEVLCDDATEEVTRVH